MSSCMSPVPDAFNVGGACGGNGVCVNSTATPGMLLCLCNAGFSGASDFFDNRVEQLPDGTWLSYSCNSSQVGTIVVWVFFLLCGMLRAKQLIPILIRFYRAHYADETKTAKGIWNNFALRIVIIDLFAVCIPFFVTAGSKLAGQTLGTDILVTVALCLTVCAFQFSVFLLTRTEFDIFVKGTMSSDEAMKAKKLRNVLKTLTLVCYVGINVTPSLFILSVDRSKGPIENDNDIVIILRNLGAAVYGLMEIWTTWMIRSRVQKLVASSSDKQDQAVSDIIAKMDKEMKTYTVFVSTIGVVYALFVMPWLAQFQTYPIAILVGLGAHRHSGKAFAAEETKRVNAQTGKHGSKSDKTGGEMGQGGALGHVISVNKSGSKETSSSAMHTPASKLVPTTDA